VADESKPDLMSRLLRRLAALEQRLDRLEAIVQGRQPPSSPPRPPEPAMLTQLLPEPKAAREEALPVLEPVSPEETAPGPAGSVALPPLSAPPEAALAEHLEQAATGVIQIISSDRPARTSLANPE
jgi:hypothetical protein